MSHRTLPLIGNVNGGGVAVPELAATGTGPGRVIEHGKNRDKLCVQAVLASTGSFTLEGRLAPGYAWQQIGAAITASGFTFIDWVPELRAVWSANATGLQVGVNDTR